MKKLYVLFTALVFSSASFAGGNNENENQAPAKSDKPMVSNGLYLGLTIGNPNISLAGSSQSSLGLQFGFDLGNQWMFYKNDKWGLGLNISWFAFGYSSKKDEGSSNVGTNAKGYNVALNFLRFGPMFSYALSDKLAFDALFNVTPVTVYFGGIPDYNYAYAASSFFTVFTPGIRIRYNQFMVGFEPSFGSMAYVGKSDNAADVKSSVSYFNPKVILGFKF